MIESVAIDRAHGFLRVYLGPPVMPGTRALHLLR